VVNPSRSVHHREKIILGAAMSRGLSWRKPSAATRIVKKAAGVNSVLSCKANYKRDWGRLALDRLSNFEWERTDSFLTELPGIMRMTLSGPFLVSRTADEV
jgi:hypothetical protein